jgi:NADH:ubiquinone reductase (H+-translocating)
MSKTDRSPHVVVVGSGFGGMAAAAGLGRAPVQVTIIDRSNHHLFQPLLYQVATAALSPADIAAPIRRVFRHQANVSVMLADATSIDVPGKRVILADGAVDYDVLILAAGVTHAYFGHDAWAEYAPGLKTLKDALAIRRRVLMAFEIAEREPDLARQRAWLTFVIVGGGPTGVELAGALAVLVGKTLRSEFRRINPASARILLIDRGPRVLASFSESLSAAAKARLERLGVEVRLGSSVEQVDEMGAVVNGERITTKTVIWAAGVAASPAGKWLNVPTDHSGRVRVANDLSVPGQPNIFVVGDTASLDEDGHPLPGVAQVAMQQGRYVAKLILRRLAGQPAPPPFRYFDKGSLAVVGKGFAVLQSRKVRLSGFVAWLAWAAVHLEFLGQSNLRVSVFVQWVWTYLTGTRGSRVIIESSAPPACPAPSPAEAASPKSVP